MSLDFYSVFRSDGIEVWGFQCQGLSRRAKASISAFQGDVLCSSQGEFVYAVVLREKLCSLSLTYKISACWYTCDFNTYVKESVFYTLAYYEIGSLCLLQLYAR